MRGSPRGATGFAALARLQQTDGMSNAFLLALIVAAAIIFWLSWRIGSRSRLRHRAIQQLLDSADALEASLRAARGEIEAVAGDQVNPVKAAMQDLLRQRLWLQEHAHDASLQQLADVRASMDRARASLEQQLSRVELARQQGA